MCDTQVIVVKAADSLDDLRCGGQPMLAQGVEPLVGVAPGSAFAGGGSAMGKRYIDESGAEAEVLVTKSGAGSLNVGAVALTLKEAKPLPASD